MKKLIALLLALVMVFALVACGGGGKNAAQGVTKDSIKIANSAATSGALAGVGLPFLAGING